MQPDVGSMTYMSWKAACSDLTVEQLRVGLKKMAGFDDFFTMAKFKQLCRSEKRPNGFPQLEGIPLGNERNKCKLAEMKKKLKLYADEASA